MLEKNYQPLEIEQKRYQRWLDHDLFLTKSPENTKTYAIMLPPPNVTGSLHMGHAFQDTLMDTLIRYHRIQGFDTLWQVGSDHAGIATQMIVERKLEAQGKNRLDFSREKFIEKIWEWKEHSGGQIMGQLKRLGIAADWSRERFTMDPKFSKSVSHAFVKLYRQGLIYRKEKLVNWDSHLCSAVSDLEVEYESEKGKLYHLRYELEDSQGEITIVTTRPETIFGDVAIAVHPEDERYEDFVGQNVLVPIIKRRIPIIVDQRVDKEFGSGCVKVTPAHDPLDFEIGQDHELESITVLTETGQLNEHAPQSLQGLDRIKAREPLAQMLKEENALILEQDYEHQVPRCARTGEVIEPRLTTQWFLDMNQMAQEGLEALEKENISFIPSMWEKHYRHWLENIKDWCLSRQLWWGHQIPAWYDEQGHVYVGESEQDVREFHSLAGDHKLTRDEDVLDTWFSSALWPMATLGWPNQEDVDWKRFFPTQVLVTGFDIIFFWVARMIMFSLHFTKRVPFKDIYIHGILQDSHGQKMSKSKGNVIDPVDLIDGISLEDLVEKRTSHMMQPEKAQMVAQQTRKDYPEGFAPLGTDALRFNFCQAASPGRFIKFCHSKLQASSNFTNKIWNLARFVFMNLENHQVSFKDLQPTSPLSHWVLGKLDHTEKKLEKHFQNYRFDLIAQELYELTWSEICDWYLELLKADLNRHDSEHKNILAFVLLKTLQLIHPVMPFITDQIYESLRDIFSEKENYPLFLSEFQSLPLPGFDDKQVKRFQKALETIGEIRTVRTRLAFPKKSMLTLIAEKETDFFATLSESVSYLEVVCGINNVTSLSKMSSDHSSLKIHLSSELFYITLPEGYDVASQLERFTKDKLKVEKEMTSLAKRLDNVNFRAKAPAEVVVKEQENLKALEDKKSDLDEIIDQLKKYF